MPLKRDVSAQDREAPEVELSETPRWPWYLAAPVVTLLALLVRVPLAGLLDHDAFMLIGTLVVVVIAGGGGLPAGLLATALVLLAAAFLPSSVSEPWVASPSGRSALVVLGLVGLVVSAAAGVRRSSMARMRTLLEQTQASHRELTDLARGLRDSEQRFRDTFEQAAVGMAHTGLDGRWLLVNQRLAEIYGFDSAEELIGHYVKELTPPEENARDAASVARLYQGASSVARDKRYVRRDGSTLWARLTMSLRRDPETGEPLALMVVVQDITKQKEVRNERERLLESERSARAEAERANHAKDELVATVSHELRTPLNAMLGWTQLLLRREDPSPAVRQGLEVLERNGRRLAQLVGDLLDMSRILSGRLRLDHASVPLASVVERGVEEARPAAAAAGLVLDAHVEAVGVVNGDEQRLGQVVDNLLSNAMKFTPRGGRVDVRLYREAEDAVLVVSDTGAGIDPAFLPHLFERFRQAEVDTSRRAGGLGIGLTIVKTIVDRHGGHIEASSAGEGQGATFTVRFPLAAFGVTRPAAPRPGAWRPLDGVDILLVEDDPDSRILTERLLEDEGARVRSATDVDEALALLEEQRPDVLVSDIGLPGRDGYDLIREIRGRRGPLRDVPAVAVTAFARAEDREHALSAGYQAHLAKPIEATSLVQAVAELAEAHALA